MKPVTQTQFFDVIGKTDAITSVQSDTDITIWKTRTGRVLGKSVSVYRQSGYKMDMMGVSDYFLAE